jgi:alpha-methylacyl-CoA racemase
MSDRSYCDSMTATGPLAGTVLIEMAGIGPVPFAAMLLGDLGADVIRVDRLGAPTGTFDIDPRKDLLSRNRRSIAVDLKQTAGQEVVRRLCSRAHALLEGFRPGVMERLNLGPDDCHAVNPALVYGRMTGWGQEGPWAPRAGHDLDYIALSGALHGVGRAADAPVPPLNLVGDYGGGAMFLAVGVLAALLRVRGGGRGQVIDAAIVDGSALFTTPFLGLRAMGHWSDERGRNLLDGTAPFYDTYRTKDGRFLALGALEPKFFAELMRLAGLDPGGFRQADRAGWAAQKARLAAHIASKTRAEWERIFDGSDACVAPVLSLEEAPTHPHNVAREVFIEAFGTRQPAPAPRFSDSPGNIRRPPPTIGEHTREILQSLDYSAADTESLIRSGTCSQATESASE